jgi:hypothetical protein
MRRLPPDNLFDCWEASRPLTAAPKAGICERPVSDIEKLRAAHALGFAVSESLPSLCFDA